MTSHERKLIRAVTTINPKIHGLRSGASKWACDVVFFKGDKFVAIEQKATHNDHYTIRRKEQSIKMRRMANEGTKVFYVIYFINRKPVWQVFPILSYCQFPQTLKHGEGTTLKTITKYLE